MTLLPVTGLQLLYVIAIHTAIQLQLLYVKHNTVEPQLHSQLTELQK